MAEVPLFSYVHPFGHISYGRQEMLCIQPFKKFQLLELNSLKFRKMQFSLYALSIYGTVVSFIELQCQEKRLDIWMPKIGFNVQFSCTPSSLTSPYTDAKLTRVMTLSTNPDPPPRDGSTLLSQSRTDSGINVRVTSKCLIKPSLFTPSGTSNYESLTSKLAALL